MHFRGEPPKFLRGFPISFVDVTGDLSSEIIFAKLNESTFTLDVWSRTVSKLVISWFHIFLILHPFYDHLFDYLCNHLNIKIRYGDYDLEKNYFYFSTLWKRNSNAVKKLDIEKGRFVGVPLFADFDADGYTDIAVPICTDRICSKVDSIQMWVNHNWRLCTISTLQVSSPFLPGSSFCLRF